MRVLAGDIGGTRARLAICEVEGTTVRRDIQEVYSSREHDSLEDIARQFIASNAPDVRAACFGVPGPVQGRRAQTTNLPWDLDADQLERNLGIKNVHLINDVEASARGLITLSTADFIELRPAAAGAAGNKGLLSAGTGLGEAGLYWDGRRHRAFACEGGHTDFAPGSAREDELLVWLRAKFPGHVSWERVVSGPGLVNILEFLGSRTPEGEEQAASVPVRAALEGGTEAAEAVVRGALRDNDPLCSEALEWFMELYGAEAGNVALKYLATGGMFVAGRLVPKIAQALKASNFIERFDGKGRLRPVLAAISLQIVTNESVALQGAAHVAASRARGEHD